MAHYISKIKEEIKSKKYSINEIAELISISGNGLHLALKNNTLKVRDLEKIAEILGVSPAVFFQDDDMNIYSNSTQVGTGNVIQTGRGNVSNSSLTTQITALKGIIKNLKEKIELKDQIIDLMKNK